MVHHISDLPNIVQRIDKDVDESTSFLPKCCIYRVNEGLRKVKPEAYEPMLVSIGPYHYRNPKVQEMKEHKRQYLHSLLKQREESVERYILELAKLEDRARECYANPIDLNSNEFVEMMLLDGFFIIEYFRRMTCQLADNDDPILNVAWMHFHILRDMVLLENQLPYFVLSQLHDMTKENPEEPPFRKLAIRIFHMLLKARLISSIFDEDRYDTHEIKHLLDLVHILSCPFSEPTSSRRNTKTSNIDAMLNQMRSVVELQEFGVKFEKAGKAFTQPSMTTDKDDDNVNIFDVKFNNGLMKVPCIFVGHFTGDFFRNLIAYEQHSPNVDPKYFSDFAFFMDSLINSKKDVNLLRLKGIIVNVSGPDKEVSDLFNGLSRGVMSSSNFYYSEVCNELNKHCGKTWNEMLAKLRRDYFNSPWAGVSTIGAIVLLLLGLAQTIVTIIK